MNTPFFRSRNNKVLAGICGGLGESMNTDPIIFRILLIVATLAGGLGIILYIFAWIVVPMRPLEEISTNNNTPSPPTQNSPCHEEQTDRQDHTGEKQHHDNHSEPLSTQLKNTASTMSILLGSIFILIGGWTMLYKLGIVEWHFSISTFLSYWPLGLIIIGCTIIPMHKVFKTIIIILIFGLWFGLCFSGYGTTKWITSCCNKAHIETTTSDSESITVPYDPSTQSATCKIELNAANSTLNLTNTAMLTFDWIPFGKDGAYKLRRTKENGQWHYEISPTTSFSHSNPTTHLSLHPDIHWNLDIEANTSDIAYDLRPFSIKTLSLESNASSSDLTLGDKSDLTDVEIENNVSSLTLHIPANSGCRLYSKSHFSNVETQNFIEKNNHIKETANYETASKKINIKIEANLGDITIEQY